MHTRNQIETHLQVNTAISLQDMSTRGTYEIRTALEVLNELFKHNRCGHKIPFLQLFAFALLLVGVIFPQLDCLCLLSIGKWPVMRQTQNIRINI